MRTTTRQLVTAALLAVLVTAGACSGGDDQADDDVATLGEGADDTGSDDDDGEDDDGGGGGRGGRAPDPEFQDAMVEFAECMREHGIDMPDPEFNGDGGVVIAGPASRADGPPSEAEREDFEEADEACQPILEEVEGAFPELDPEEEAEMQEQALEFAECMREHGIDMPDPVFSEGGRTQVQLGDGDGGPGFDPRDEDFQEAAEECGGEGGFVGGFSVSEDEE